MSEKNTKLQVATREATLTVEPSVAQILSAAVSGGVTPDNVEVVERMMALMERNEARQAEKDFAGSLADLQAETCRVQATKAVDQKADGTCRYRFAPYEEIMAKVQPMLTRHGFSISFDSEVGDSRLTSICTLTHRGGHSRKNSFAVKYTTPPGSSAAQGDMSTKSYAKRGALCDALNIVVDKDDDGRNEGDPTPITASQAADLRAKCEEVNADKVKFLAFAGAATFEAIQADKLDELWDSLERKARK